jgi:hypothetical protein
MAEDQDWVKTHSEHPGQTPVEIKDLEELETLTQKIDLKEGATSSSGGASGAPQDVMPNFDDIPDMEEEFESMLQEQEDPGALMTSNQVAGEEITATEDNILKTRYAFLQVKLLS